ncbi:hypothetical protein INT47_006798 [Mucor saturninus]|uniref:Kinetochore protein Nuf2 N-terminal domain-containing protein n=1 Tax=Mucor saturninus TaxID=64648 RepID=A0A8H7QZU3_9FUNG|nr:hypothetical protein INT47_006798 [Mucor saturninus]
MEDFRSRSLAIKELVANLRECGFSVSELDFHKPTSSRTLDLYTFFFKLLDPWMIPAYRSLLDNAKDRLQLAYIDQTVVFNAMEDITIHGFLKDFLSMISVPDFDLTDILTPTPQRQTFIVLALNNFTVEALRCKRHMLPLLEPLKEQAETFDRLLAEKDSLEKLLKEKQKRKEEDNRLADLKVSENEKIRETLFEYRKESEVNGTSLKLDREKRQRLKDSVSSVHFALMDCKSKYTVFKDNIDIDIEKAEAEMKELAHKTDIVKQEQLKKQQELAQHRVERALAKSRSELLDQLKQSAAENKRLEAELKRLWQSVETMQKEKEAALDEERELKQIINQIEINLRTTELEMEKCDEQDAKLDETKKIYWEKSIKQDDELRETLKELRRAEDALNEETKGFQKQINEVLSAHMEVMELLAPKIQLLDAQMERLLLETED